MKSDDERIKLLHEQLKHSREEWALELTRANRLERKNAELQTALRKKSNEVHELDGSLGDLWDNMEDILELNQFEQFVCTECCERPAVKATDFCRECNVKATASEERFVG